MSQVMKDRHSGSSAAVIVTAAAALFLAGCAPQGQMSNQNGASVASVKCYGANACKGQAECKTAANGCKGQNACKGQGYVMLEERACVEALKGRG